MIHISVKSQTTQWHRSIDILDRQMSNLSESEEIPPPPTLTEPDLSETLRRSAVDVLLLSFFALAFTVVAFLKFFRFDV